MNEKVTEDMATGEFLPLALALSAGLGLGIFFFGGLWLTVERIVTARRPEVLTLGSFAGRTVITLLGFYLVSGGQIERLLTCLLGFLVIRSIIMRRWRSGWLARRGRTN